MEQYRQSTQAANIEEQSYEQHDACGHDDNHVSALETLGGHRNMGHWELSHISAHNLSAQAPKTHDQIMDSLVAKNRFHALCEEEDEGHMSPVRGVPKMAATLVPAKQVHSTWKIKAPTVSGITTETSLSEYPWLTRVSQGTRKKWRRRVANMSSGVEEVELSNVDAGYGSEVPLVDGKRVELTIDSGAAEHVVGPRDLPHIPIGASRRHVQYTMANGQRTCNKGEQHVMAVTSDGHEITFKAQVTDVHRPLMSVSRICDKGNRVVFESHGGYIESLTTGEKLQVRRDHNVYRLQVDVPESGSHGKVHTGPHTRKAILRCL